MGLNETIAAFPDLRPSGALDGDLFLQSLDWAKDWKEGGSA
jgi:hypothetical protein